MADFTTRQLLDYLRGRASPELSGRISQAAREDGDVAFRLEMLRDNLPKPTARTPSNLKVYAVVFSVGIATGLAAAVAYFAATVPHGTTEETPRQDKTTEPLKAAGIFTRLEVGRPTVRFEKDYTVLLNRGSIVTVDEFPVPYEVSFDWRWLDLLGNSDYPEILNVILHTAGTHSKKDPFRMADGMDITFRCASGFINIINPKSDLVGKTAEQAVDLSEGQWHSVRVVDDGKQIEVFVFPKGKEPGKAVLAAPYQWVFQKHRIAIYNREFRDDRPHETHIANFTVRALPKKAGQ